MKPQRFAEIRELVERFDTLPDAAFVAAMDEHDVSTDDLVRYAREREKKDRSVRLARRRS